MHRLVQNPTSDHTSYDTYNLPNSANLYLFRGDQGGRIEGCFPVLGDLHEHAAVYDFPRGNAVNLSISKNDGDVRAKNVSVVSDGSQFGGLDNSFGSAGMGLTVGTGHFTLQKGCLTVVAGGGGGCCLGLTNGLLEKLCNSGAVADDNQHNGKHQLSGVGHEILFVSESTEITEDHKAIRRLAQNREAARRSRQGKKARVQQLVNCNLRLSQLQRELQSAQKQVNLGISGDQAGSSLGSGDLAFDMDYTRWFDEHQLLTHERDVFHILSGMWKTPAERCCMWLGGFRSSNLLKIIGQQIEPLVEPQFVDICNLQQCCQEAEDAFSQGVEALRQSVAGTLFPYPPDPCTSAKIADYMGQMSIAMTKLASLEDFLHQADMLRQQTMQQLLRILTIRQAAQALIAISDYKSKLQALNSLWLARPKE